MNVLLKDTGSIFISWVWKMNKIKTFFKENIIIIALTVCIGAVYAYGMFSNKPWYDELYTYYYFISKGPVYAGIHWPVPNNHIGYSVLSAFFDLVFNQYIGLRGVSVISSIINIVLIYRLTYRLLGKKMYGYLAAIVFAGNYLVNSLAIQGRGYALTTLCLLTALNCLISIIYKDYEVSKKRFAKTVPYIVFALSLTLGLYAIPSSLYWVMPTCLFGGYVLMMQRRYKEMRKLIYFAVVAAILTFGLYTIVWLAIGANLLSKDAASGWFGVYQVNIITHAPVASFKTGIEYMLATPYIQSTDRATVITGLWKYFGDLFNLYVGGIGNLITVLIVVSTVVACVKAFKVRTDRDKNAAEYSAGAFLGIFVIVLPVMLIIQSVQPYKRVFSYFAVIWAFSLAYLLKVIVEKIKDSKKSMIVFAVLSLLISAGLLVQTYRNSTPLADRENDIYEVLEKSKGIKGFDPTQLSSVYYTDDYQKFVIKFYYDVEPVETTLEEAEYVFVSSDLLSADGMRDWPMFTNSDDFKYDYVTDNFEVLGETAKYSLYRRIVSE